MGEDEFRVRCIISDEEDGQEKASETMKQAHKSLIEEGFSVCWIRDSDCLKIDRKEKNCVYLYDPFGGKSFNHIKNLGCRIFGPLCILSSLEYKLDIPKRNVPVYNLAMKDVVICCTNLVKQRRNEIHDKVEAMGGTVSRDLTNNVTHLIAGEVGSKKYQVAATTGKHIYLPCWVDRVWEASQSRHIHGSSSQFLEYSCPIFKGLVITVSGLDSEERNQVKKAVEAEGGKYTGEMKVNECTHLIINKPKGAKYEFAKKWKIHIVKSDWLYDSIEKGYCLEERQFSLTDDMDDKSEVKTSTPEKENGCRVDRNSTLADISCISNVSMIQRTHLNETSSTTQNRKSTDEFETTLESIDLSKSSSDLFLDGCKIYLSGFRGVALEKLRKVINAGGATRLNTLSENVTHVIVGERIEKDLEMLRRATYRPHVLTPVWMAECFRQGFTVSEDPYRLSEFPTMDPQSPQGKRKLSEVKNKEPQEERPVEKPGAPDGDDDEFSDIMSQYLLQADQGPAPSGERTVIDTAAVPTEKGATQEPQATPEEEEGPIFNKKVFMFFGFEEEHEGELIDYIVEKGGTVSKATSRVIPDYGVVPINGFPVDRTVQEIVTNAWVQICLEQDRLLDVSSNVLFSPMDIKMDAAPLTGCVLSVSGFAGTERDCLMHIAELLGAECQEYFVRKASKDLKASTHLVVKEAEGSKYQAAKKWNIPAISRRWIFKCAKSGKREAENNFLIENELTDSQNLTTSVQIPIITNAQIKQSDSSQINQSSHKNQKVDCEKVESPEEMECDKWTGAPDDKGHLLLNSSDKPDNNDKEMKKEEENSKGGGSKEKPETWESGMETNQDDLLMLGMDTGENSRQGSLRGGERKESPEKTDIPESQKENMAGVKTPNLTNQRVKELKTDEREINPRNTSRRESLNESTGSLDLEKSFHPRFDFSDVLKNLETPEGQKGKQRKVGRRKSSLPFDELFEEAIHAAAKFTTEYKTMATADEVDGVCDRANDNLVRPLKGVIIYVSKKLSGQQAELNDLVAELGGDYKWQYDTSCTHFIFQGKTNDTTKEFRIAREQKKIIVSPLWLRLCKEQNVRVDESLFPHSYNPNMTLSVVRKATPGRSSPVKSIATRSTPQRGTRRSTRASSSKQSEGIETDDLPKPTSPTSLPTVTDSKLNKRSGATTPEPSDKQQRMSPDSEAIGAGTDAVTEEPIEMAGTLDYREELAKQLKEDMAVTKIKKTQGRRKSRKFNCSGQMNMSGDGSSNDSGAQSRSGSRAGRWSMTDDQKDAQKSEAPAKESSLPESSQTVHVMWDDPTGRLEQEKLAHKLQRACSPTQDVHNVQEMMDAQFSDVEEEHPVPQLPENEPDRRLSSPPAPPVAFHRQSEPSVPSPQPVTIVHDVKEDRKSAPPIFILSGMSQEERDDYGVLVENLGGRMLDGQNFDPSCTHLVIGVPARNEKFLACVASGKWVLHKSYFEACRQEGKFVQEDFYEWGGEGTASLLEKMNPAVRKLCEAAHSWRLKINSASQSCVGAFSDWKVLLCTDRKKEDNFRRLLEAGGATVNNVKPPFSKSVSASHAFMELNKVEMSEDDIGLLVKLGVICVKPDFIAAHLTNNPAPNPDDYCPSEVKTLLQSLPGKRKMSLRDDSRKRPRR
ncbi:DNA topoisomerase 2-binding protein 1-like [Ostrea edulis]|uniref:DNA topoisomerase 2-binding protein 1-like n=1 Tax=Ostrea edulis TaxID=37623 RepID=UPI0024AF3245|nr:DNA topoisomerase 2-binding protein 1-like [Ostrea edulis]XP_055995896.1 DNA topoisomerase 2-binding protein 1-like [Ostrea edulis]XP_055995897.1 DNA topoisomerase 2-binding protein 1-like [Ostrea edulis]XP_055995898.1 DNA topoisomerase 2-binding protein 1-like [Ostrea edulis]XP_055995899.1 DNA topoisomerase 2-binding protein 1-like [Ostrea edulis]XP_055995900.1 DNA topoisomerase 2-binding protein 1-like [Ostrea edulis]XP_055995901.1 DNA topoisomerase 2-binding protein 1-like [Ostrea eduli